MAISPDHLECLLLPAGGKDAVVELCTLLHRLNVDWRAVLDWDACLNDDFPRTLDGLDAQTMMAAVAAANVLLGTLDDGTKRGRNAKKNILSIKDEFDSGRPEPTVFTGSQLDRLLTSCAPLSVAEKTLLIDALINHRKRVYRQILSQHQTWVWSGTVEDAILSGNGSEVIATNSLRSLGHAAPSARHELIGFLHNNANSPSLLQTVVQSIDNAGKFSRTEVNAAFSFLFDDLLGR